MVEVIESYKAVKRYVIGSGFYRSGCFHLTSWSPKVTLRNMKRYGINIVSVKKEGNYHSMIIWSLPNYITEDQRNKFIAKITLEERLAREQLARSLNKRGIFCTPENSIELFNAVPINILLEADANYELGLESVVTNHQPGNGVKVA